jgi:DNA (cytosine-5)-methyltransferase 1
VGAAFGDVVVRVGSLFSGYGGLDMAVGGELAWYSEIEPAACKVMEAHHPGVPNLGDITKVDWSAVEPVDVITGGYPCQPFSNAGKRKGKDDERHLWPHVRDAIGAIRPRYAVLENVRGHLTLGFAAVLADLACLGLSARWGVIRAADAGAPHNRARLFVLANTDIPGGKTHLGRSRTRDTRRLQLVERGWSHWSQYLPAITQWEHIIGRAAPAPTVRKRERDRLNPVFVEWMMGLPEGWVTGHGLSASQELKMLGNGVVPQQAALALRLLGAP